MARVSKRGISRRACVLSLGILATLCSELQRWTSWRSQCDRSTAFLQAQRPGLGRREVFASSILGLGLGVPLVPQRAVAIGPRPINKKDLAKIKAGYQDLLYLQANWNKVTRVCEKQGGKVEYSLPSGVLSPDNCIAQPDVVRAYLGNRSLQDNLFKTEQLWIDIEAADMISAKDEDRWQEATDEFERHKREADAWAYTSSWGEANPGGGRDKVEDFLLRSKFEVDKAVKSLGEIVEILQL
mmetsp:Transcript_10656/g.19339  ORF Transcript_10656/g.19339 Transcript_10656/m.19339 type:complete len:241 (-) Transcript_10656:143-865(-)